MTSDTTDDMFGWDAYHDPSSTSYGSSFSDLDSPIFFKPRLMDVMADLRRQIAGDVDAMAHIEGEVVIERGARVHAGAVVVGPVLICEGAEVRHTAYVRDSTIIGAGAKIGHASEIARSIIGPMSRALHFAFVGDSFLGSDVNIGSSCVFSTLRLTGPITEPATEEILVRLPSGRMVPTGSTKFGAIVGDSARTASHISIAPASLIGKGATILPRSESGGTVPPFARVR